MVADMDDRDGSVVRDQLSALRRRWLIVVASIMVAVGIASALSLSATPQYDASAEILISPVSREKDDPAPPEEVTPEEVATQVGVVTSDPVARRVAKRLGLSQAPTLDDSVVAEAVGTSRIVRITATDPDPQQAADMANAVAQAYLTQRKGNDGGGRSAGRLLRDAEASDTPASPQPVLTGVLAGLIGLLVGIGLALLRDRLDDRVYDESDVRRSADGAPLLVTVPSWDSDGSTRRYVALTDPHSPAGEAFGQLAVNARYLLNKRTQTGQASVILTSSARPGEGKTSVAGNLAVATARAGKRVLLIDADLRRGQLAQGFGLSSDLPGLGELLIDPASEVAPVPTGMKNLSLLPGGTPPANPTALLASPRLRELLLTWSRTADVIVIDAPPVGAVADAFELLDMVDLIVAVVRHRRSRRREISGLIERFAQLGGTPVALVHVDAPRKQARRAPYPSAGSVELSRSGRKERRERTKRPAATGRRTSVKPARLRRAAR